MISPDARRRWLGLLVAAVAFAVGVFVWAVPRELRRRVRPWHGHVLEGRAAHVVFTADFEGGDGTVEDGLWGYYLERGADGRWHITDAGVA